MFVTLFSLCIILVLKLIWSCCRGPLNRRWHVTYWWQTFAICWEIISKFLFPSSCIANHCKQGDMLKNYCKLFCVCVCFVCNQPSYILERCYVNVETSLKTEYWDCNNWIRIYQYLRLTGWSNKIIILKINQLLEKKLIYNQTGMSWWQWLASVSNWQYAIKR